MGTFLGLGKPPHEVVFFKGFLGVHRGTGVLTHCQMAFLAVFLWTVLESPALLTVILCGKKDVFCDAFGPLNAMLSAFLEP